LHESLSLLEVKNLVVEFPGRRGTLRALDDISFSIAPGEILGVVGESGAGKSLTGAAIIGLLESPGAWPRARSCWKASASTTLHDAHMRHIRGRRIGAIFQDPLTSLNPLYTVGRQLTETILAHLPVNAAEARRPRAIQLLQGHRHSGGRAAHGPLPAPVLGRHAPAGGDCPGAGGRAAS
jgi:peptide/nickel transport system ATP-binding protein